MKILIVDDEKLIRLMIKHTIEKMEHEYCLANNGQEAYEILKKDFSFDVIISDFNMPFMNGLELRLKIESDFKSCPPFILFSGNIDQVKGGKYEKMFYTLLEKGSDINLLVGKIKEIENFEGVHPST